MPAIFCQTNLDLVNEQWPDFLPAVPREGDHIQSKTKHGIFQLSLRVEKVSWQFHERVQEWKPIIELHDTQSRSIRDFFEWYAPLVNRPVSAFI